MSNKNIDVINFFGSNAKTARAVGVSKTAVSKWAKGGNISIDNSKKIERLTHGQITKEHLRADVFG